MSRDKTIDGRFSAVAILTKRGKGEKEERERERERERSWQRSTTAEPFAVHTQGREKGLVKRCALKAFILDQRLK